MLFFKNKSLFLFINIFLAIFLVVSTAVYFVINKSLKSEERSNNNEELSFETINKGIYSGHNQKNNYVIVSRNDFENLWNKVYYKTVSKPPLPEIDFNKYIVLAVFQGVKNTGGYDTQIFKISREEGYFDVLVRETSPSPECVTTQALTSPFHIIKVEKMSSEVNVRFDAREEMTDC